MRPGIGERIEIPKGDPVAVTDALLSSGFTGLMSIRERKTKIDTLFLRGKLLRVLKTEGDTTFEIPPQTFQPPYEGTIEVIGSDHLALIGSLIDSRIERSGLFYITGFGDRLEDTKPLQGINLREYAGKLKEMGFSGYMLIHTEREPEAIILFREGKVVRIYPEGFRLKEKEGAFISSAILDDALIPMLISLERAEPARSGSLRNPTRMSQLIAEEKASKMNLLLDIRKGKEIESYFLFHGILVGAFRRNLPVVEPITAQDPIVQGRFNIYRLNPVLNPADKEAELFGKEEKCTEEELLKVKEAFTEITGRVGKILWEKVINELELDEKLLSRQDLDRLVGKLAKEIPDKNTRMKFLSRVGRAVQ